MGKYRTRELTQRVRYALLAGVAGAFLIPQVAAAAPTGEHDYTTPGVSVDRSTANTTKITSTATNNVINWRDYSVNQGETVQYDGGNKTNNYLNIVTGANTSNINGRIEGGKNVYIVNPNGVIFGKTASVNVGNLYVSTQDTSTVNTAADMANNVSPLSASAAGLSDVVNMGKITANTVEVHGKNIRFLNAANVTATDRILYTDTANGGYAHIGYRGTVPTNYKVNPTTTNPAGVSPEYYQLVKDKTELDAINNSPASLAGNYMLENDIDFYDSVTGTKKSLTPIGGDSHVAFSGKFDGNFFRIQNFTVSGTSRAGAFGETNGARIDNVGITGATITGGTTTADYAGGVVGYATSSTLKNVYSDSGTRISGAAGRHGGIAGYTSDTTIESAYSKATIGAGGGIIGNATANTKVTDTYSEVISTGYTGTTPLGAWFIYNINPITGPGAVTVDRAYYVGDRFSYSNVSANIQHVYKIDKNTINSTYKATIVRPTGSTPAPQDEKEGLTVGTYTSEWGNAINNTGAPGAKWRIYEGRTLPLLTAFMDGTATATYDIRYFNANGTLNTESANTAKSNNGADITTGLTYNSQYVKIVGKASGADVVGGKSNVVTYAGAMQYNADGTPNLDHIYDYVNAGTNDFDKTNGIRNAGTKAILWSDQDGPNLRGVNVTIGKRKVDMTVADLGAERQYNGKLDVKDAFIEKLLGGGISTDGFTREDADPNHPTVSLNTTGFTATMVDKHVGTGKVANFGGSIGLSGEDKDNYDFDGNLAGKTGTVKITKAPLLLSFRKKKAADRVYDGTSVVRDDEMKQSVSPGNISINKTIAAGSRGEVMTDETGTADVLALADITDPKYTDTSG
ncbi:filamentous hemagglutinin N-terminal domain-containing protein, partial [uncultured Selenomonas sp.]|uniref:two-partner secretion domain-containing protein n=1 Tax=uncultured Selenomonas sp. TaxID=159275 RepID=UPI0025F6E30A